MRRLWEKFSVPKFLIFVVFLVVLVFMMSSRQLDFWTVQIPVQSSSTSSSPSRDRKQFCSFPPQSEEDDLEQRHLLSLVSWPEAPAVRLNLRKTSSPKNSFFTIDRRQDKWHVGDQLQIQIQMKDFEGVKKKFGGDVIMARLYNQDLGAGVAGQVLDHLNGSYSATFPLLWTGGATVEVTLVHPTEAVSVLQRLNIEEPDRVSFVSVFRRGSVSQSVNCNICSRPNGGRLCNFTDIQTGEPWFCSKPPKLSCNDRIDHAMGHFDFRLRDHESQLFQSGINLKVTIGSSGQTSITILPGPESGLKKQQLRPSGYYLDGDWRTLGGTTVQNFYDSSTVSQCLRGKTLHLYGDSTVRQLYEYLTATLPGLTDFDLHTGKMVGPFIAFDNKHNILVNYRPHGVPIRILPIPTSELRYISSELDNIAGGRDTVVILGVWAHFGTFPIEIYIRRLQNIRRAVVRLLNRSPETVVIIRTANPKELELTKALLNSDFYSLQRDIILRAIFKDQNVQWLDAWDMVLAHHLPHMLHPPPAIIKNMIDVVLSYICPP